MSIRQILNLKLTACIIQIIKVILNEDIIKKLTISSENLRNINLSIEIIVLLNIQQYLIKISKNEAKFKICK